TIRTDTVGIMTAIKSKEGCGLLSAPLAWATLTTIVMTTAWIAMLSTLTPPPTKNCRNMLALISRSDRYHVAFAGKATQSTSEYPQGRIGNVLTAAAVRLFSKSDRD